MRMSLPVVTTTERSTFRRCPQKWWWKFRMGLTPKAETADALWFGIGIHEALAQWYGKGKRRSRVKPADYFAEWVGEEIRYIRTTAPEDWDDQPKYEDAAELGVAMLTAYLEKYGRDPDWDVIAIESPFSVRVTRGGKEIAIFKSTFDGVKRDLADGRIYLVEHKTAGQIQTSYLELDDQGGVYWALAGAILRSRGILKPGEDIAGIEYNFLRKAKPDPRPQNEGGAYLNKDGSVSKKQPSPLFVRHIVERLPSESKTQLTRLSDEVAVMNAIRDGVIPVTKSTGKDCTFCEFFVMCRLHEQGNDNWKELARSECTVQDPYSRYSAKSAGG